MIKTEQAIRDGAIIKYARVAGHFFTNETKTNKKLSRFIRICKTIWSVPSHLLVSGRRNAIPCQMEPAQRRLMRRAPPRNSAEIQTCFIMYPLQPCLPCRRKCEKKPSAAGEQRAKKNEDHMLRIHIDHLDRPDPVSVVMVCCARYVQDRYNPRSMCYITQIIGPPPGKMM